MPGFEDVLHMPLEKLNEAVEDWDRQVRAFESDSGMVGKATTMAQRARTVNWAGENASVTLPYVTAQAEQFDAALTQARTLRELCRDAYARLRSRQDALREVVEVDAPARGVHVRASGEVTADYEGLDDATRRERQEAVIEISAEIERVLTRAAEDDAVIAQALRDAMGTDPYRFTLVDYGSLNEAQRAYEDAQVFLALAERGGELTDSELGIANSLLSRYANDPAFAERVATELGTATTLSFLTDLTSYRRPAPDSGEWALLASFQENLGTVLGTATRSDSPAMERWEDEMLTLAPNRLNGAPDAPYGFQVMSALMNAGEYDTDFLLAYGDKLLDFERADDRPASQLWDSDPYLSPLNFSTERDEHGDLVDTGNIGHDPVIGFLNALGHNPDASTQFFAPPDDFDPTAAVDLDNADSVEANMSRVNEHLAYLATEREWWNSVDHQGPADSIPVHQSLGNALLSAATGRPPEHWDAAHLEEALSTDMRSSEAARVMEQVMHLYGTVDPVLLQRQPEMGASLGNMASTYMSDMNYWISADTDIQRELHEGTYAVPYGEHLQNGRTSTLRFLTTLGQNEDAHQILTDAVQIYAIGNLDRFPPTSEDNFREGIESLRTAGEIRGIIDYARVDQVKQEFGENSQEAAQALGSVSGWLKAGSSGFVGATVGAGVAVAGATLTGGAAVIVPIAAGTGGSLLAEFFNRGIDGSLGGEQGIQRQAIMREQEFYGAGAAEYAMLKERYMADATAMEERNPGSIDRALNDLDDRYETGREWAEAHGN